MPAVCEFTLYNHVRDSSCVILASPMRVQTRKIESPWARNTFVPGESVLILLKKVMKQMILSMHVVAGHVVAYHSNCNVAPVSLRSLPPNPYYFNQYGDTFSYVFQTEL